MIGQTTYRNAFLAFVLASLALSWPMGASVARHVAFDQKVDEAESIVFGKCLDTQSSFDPSGKWIITRARFQVEKSIKGNAGSTVEVMLPGGTVNGIHQETVGVPSYEKGDERVLFVKRGKLGASVLYLDQGSYAVQQDSSGRRSVAPAASDLILLDAQTGKVAAVEGIRSLDTFERDVAMSTQRVAAQRLNQSSALSAAGSAPRDWRTNASEFFEENRLLLALLALGALIAVIPLLKRR